MGNGITTLSIFGLRYVGKGCAILRRHILGALHEKTHGFEYPKWVRPIRSVSMGLVALCQSSPQAMQRGMRHKKA
jgi:hypothetical protein